MFTNTGRLKAAKIYLYLILIAGSYKLVFFNLNTKSIVSNYAIDVARNKNDIVCQHLFCQDIRIYINEYAPRTKCATKTKVRKN